MFAGAMERNVADMENRNHSGKSRKGSGTCSKGQVRGRDYVLCRRALIEALEREREAGTEMDAVLGLGEKLSRSFERAVTERLVEAAVHSPSPIDSVLLLAAGDLAEQWHCTSPLVASSRRSGASRRVAWDAPMPFDQLKKRLNLVDRLIAIKRALASKKK